MLTHTTQALFAVVAAGVFLQLLTLLWVGGKLLRPRLARRLKRTPPGTAAPVAVLGGERSRRRLRRDYRLALHTTRA
jgi:uncharacterized SAM-binding protein YcdF (DUF218 family)